MLHNIRWNGLTTGHGIAGKVSGVEAAIHCGDELWFGVNMKVSERDQNLDINTGRNGKNPIWNLAAVECRPHLHQICSKLQ